MHILRYIRFLSILTVLFSYYKVFGAEVLSGNSESADASFAFEVQEHVFDERTGNFFVAADPQVDGAEQANNFAISAVFERDKYRFEPLTPQFVSVNGVENMPNPLFDAGIAHMGLVSGEVIQKQSNPIVVKSTEPSVLYFFESVTPPKLVARVLPDAHGLVNGGIVGLSRSAPDYVFAAVKPNGGDLFGAEGSGIAVLVLGTSEIDVPAENRAIEQGTEKNTEVEKDAKKEIGEPQLVKKTVLNLGFIDLENGIPKALPFDITIDQLKIGNNLADMGQIVDIHWDNTIGRVYIALQLTAGSQVTDGGRALVVGRIQQTMFENPDKKTVIQRTLELEKIAPDEAFNNDQNNIVGTIGAHAQVSLHKVRTMFTSTSLHYVVVVGGNGDVDATKRSVYALPVVSNSSRSANNGLLASKNAIPIDEFYTGKIGVPDQFVRRDIKQPALTQDDMFIDTDAAVRVGAGDIDAGDITDIFIRGDAVYVTVGIPSDPNEQSGIFYSQAIFNELGLVKAWTGWRRVAGTTDQVFGGAFDIVDANFLFITNDDTGTVNTVKRTVWNNGAKNGLFDLNKIVSQELPITDGGIQGFVDLPGNAPGLHNISLMMMTGHNKVVLVESGQLINNVLYPSKGLFAEKVINFNNGTITTTLPLGFDNPKVVTIAGGVLDDIGPLIAAEVVRDGDTGNNGWLFVGGTNGLAVLSAANGDGWNSTIGLGPDFVGLEEGMSFKLIPDYTFVRKLVQDGNFLYVLTDKKLDRIDLTQGNIGLGQAASVTVATHTNLVGPSGFFSDCMISGKFAVIATSRGLLRVGNGKDIRLSATVDESSWTLVPMPEGVKGVRQLLGMSKTGMLQDVARNDGGQLYALNVDRGTNRSEVTRFAVNSVEDVEIDDNTIVSFPDFYVRGLCSFRMNFGALKTVFSTDGALYLSGHGIDLEVKPAVTFPRDSILSRFVGVKQVSIPLALDASSHITNMVRSFASGSWLISGDFGLRINE